MIQSLSFTVALAFVAGMAAMSAGYNSWLRPSPTTAILHTIMAVANLVLSVSYAVSAYQKAEASHGR